MDEEKLLPDFLLAITIMVVLFWFMVVVDDAVSVEIAPVPEPVCQDRYQLTHKAVLQCAPASLSQR